ncbi:MAG: DUF1571 domain-containing protein [Planctomycetales bacterium]|nr:DUF1571 domain-containing protein [Planctomycetales bacterium]
MFKSPAFHRIVSLSALAASALATTPLARAQQDRWVEPIMRVAHEEPAPTQVASRIVPGTPAPGAPFDLTQRPGEHPLMPALRLAKGSLATIDNTIRDYSAIMYKQERIDGELMDQEVAYIKVRHQPYSVYMFFLAPNKGRECMYVEGPNGTNGKLLARDCGFRRKLGVFELDPNGRLAMKGQKYPITKLGVKALTDELVMVASNDVQFGECEVQHLQTELGPKTGVKRPVTLLDVTHPVERRNFRFHKARVYIDNELRIPIRYEAYLWPERPGEAPPLEETYTYMNLKVNNGFTDADFSRENPEYFKD